MTPHAGQSRGSARPCGLLAFGLVLLLLSAAGSVEARQEGGGGHAAWHAVPVSAAKQRFLTGIPAYYGVKMELPWCESVVSSIDHSVPSGTEDTLWKIRVGSSDSAADWPLWRFEAYFNFHSYGASAADREYHADFNNPAAGKEVMTVVAELGPMDPVHCGAGVKFDGECYELVPAQSQYDPNAVSQFNWLWTIVGAATQARSGTNPDYRGRTWLPGNTGQTGYRSTFDVAGQLLDRADRYDRLYRWLRAEDAFYSHPDRKSPYYFEWVRTFRHEPLGGVRPNPPYEDTSSYPSAPADLYDHFDAWGHTFDEPLVHQFHIEYFRWRLQLE